MCFIRQGDFAPQPADLRNVTLTRSVLEMAEHLASNAHDLWAYGKQRELRDIGLSLLSQRCHVASYMYNERYLLNKLSS